MSGIIYSNRRNDDAINSDEDGSEENELSPDLVANLDDLIANNDQRLHNYLVAHGYMREQDRNEIGDEIDEEYDSDSEWNPSEDEGSQDGDIDGENSTTFHMHDDSSEKLHSEMILEEGKRWIRPRDEPVINDAKPCDCSRFSPGSQCLLLNWASNWTVI
jgi:hypothetical protein